MLNNGLSNNVLWNDIGILVTSQASATYPFVLNGVPFVDTPTDPDDYIIVTNFRDPKPARVRQIASNLRIDGGKIVTSRYEQRQIFMDIAINKPTRELMEAYLDSVVPFFEEDNIDLTVKYAGQFRKYKCNLTNEAFGEWMAYPRNYLETTLELTCYDPFGYDTNNDYGNYEGVTSEDYTIEYTNTGSQETFLFFSFNFSEGSSITGFDIVNNTNSESYSVDDTILGGSRIDVDCPNRTTTKYYLGVESILDPDGRYIKAAKGTNSITITVNSSSHDYDLTVVSSPAYI